MRKNWGQYYQITRDRPPTAGLLKAVGMLGRTGTALDLGCGAGSDTRYLLAQGFQVTAVDREAIVRTFLADLPAERFRFVQATFEDFIFEQYDLINAHYALPFLSQEQFSLVLTRLKAALKPGGIFVGQFFGVGDSWNRPEIKDTMTFLTRRQALDQLSGLEILEFLEENTDGLTSRGAEKRWHVYHIIARHP